MQEDNYIETTVRSRGNSGSGLDITSLTNKKPLLNRAELVCSGTQPFEMGVKVPLSNEVVTAKENTLFLSSNLNSEIQRHLKTRDKVSITLIEKGNAIFIEPSLEGRRAAQIEKNLKNKNIVIKSVFKK